MKFSIKGLAIGTLSSASVTGAGFVGWKCYDNAYPTVDNALGQQGYLLSVPSTPTDIAVHTPAKETKFQWKNWDCSNRLFPGARANKATATGNQPTPINISDDSKKNAGKAVGCAAMHMHPWTDQGQTPQSRFYFQMEMAVRNDKFGFILWSGILLGKFSNTSGATSFDFEHRMFLLENEDGKWTIRGGYAWNDASLPTDFNVDANFLVIKTSDGYWLDKEIINTWSKSNSWAGVWEETDDAKGHHPLKDIVIGLGTNSDTSKYDVEVYGLDEGFAANNSSHPGYGQVSKYYDTSNSLWNTMKSVDKKSELNNWYSPFNDKKGKWTEMGKRCGSLSVSRQKLSEVGPIKDLCYQRTTDSSI